MPENRGSEAVIMKVISGFLPFLLPQPGTRAGKHACTTTSLECAVSGHSDCREPAAALER